MVDVVVVDGEGALVVVVTGTALVVVVAPPGVVVVVDAIVEVVDGGGEVVDDVDSSEVVVARTVVLTTCCATVVCNGEGEDVTSPWTAPTAFEAIRIDTMVASTHPMTTPNRFLTNPFSPDPRSRGITHG